MADLAERLSLRLGTTIDASALARLERGERGVKLDEAVAISDELRVPLLQLVGRGGDAELRSAEYEVEQAELILQAAREELERRQEQAESARTRLLQLEQQELLDDLRTARWPIGT